jgi:hypothetical protein
MLLFKGGDDMTVANPTVVPGPDCPVCEVKGRFNHIPSGSGDYMYLRDPRTPAGVPVHYLARCGVCNTLESFTASDTPKDEEALNQAHRTSREDASARAEVEKSLYDAGIIEDPDIDGGLLG